MDESLVRAVRERAEHRCEYCRVPQSAYPTVTFPVDGRTTIAVLALNDPDAVAVRQALIDEGGFPPTC